MIALEEKYRNFIYPANALLLRSESSVPIGERSRLEAAIDIRRLKSPSGFSECYQQVN